MFCSVSIQRFSELGFSHISSNENFHRLRFQVFQAPEGIQFPGRCLVYRGGGEKRVNTKHFMTKTVENVLNTVQ